LPSSANKNEAQRLLKRATDRSEAFREPQGAGTWDYCVDVDAKRLYKPPKEAFWEVIQAGLYWAY
jgi:hypothetical protein